MTGMLDKTNIAAGSLMVLAGLGEMVAMRGPCPTCIAAIGGGSALIVQGMRIKKSTK